MAEFDPTLFIGGGALASMFALGVLFIVLVLLFILALYLYTSLALMAVAKRLKDPAPWLAWIPIANLVLMARLAKMHWWPVLLLIGALIPLLGIFFALAFAVFAFIWQWKICEARKRPGWWALLQLIPFVGGIWGLVMWGLLAWSKD